MEYALDRALNLSGLEEGEVRVDGSKAYWNFNSAFGGWMVAAAVSAVRNHSKAVGDLMAVNAVFTDPIPGEMLRLSIRCIRARSRTSFWQVAAEVDAAEGTAHSIFEAQVVLSKRSPHDVRFDRSAPDAPEPETIEESVFPIGPKWLQRYRQKFIAGTPFTRQTEPRTLTWIEESDGRPWDELGLLAVCDTFMPRVFFADTTPRFGSTVSLGIQLFTSADELAELGSGPLLLEGNSDAIALGSFDQRGTVWSRDGQLLAVTNQIAVFR